MKTAITAALAVFFCAAGFYTSLGPLSSFRSDYRFSANAIAAVALIAVIVLAALVLAFAVLRAGTERSLWAVPALWIVPLAVSTLLGVDPASGLQVCGIALLSAVFYVAAIRFAARSRVRAIVAASLVCGLAASLSGIAMNLAHVPHDLDVFNHGRASGVFATANYFGAFLVTLALTSIATAIAFAGPLRALAAATALSAAAGLALSYSRGAQLGTIAGAGLLFWWLGYRRAAACAAAALAVAGALALAHPDVHHDPSENYSRWAIWKTGWRVAQLFPLTGAGPMGYHSVEPAVEPAVADPASKLGKVQPHNVVLSLWADVGTAGVAAIAAGWVVFGRRLRAGAARSDRPFAVLSLGLCAALAGTLGQGMVDLVGPPELIFVWLPFAGLAAAAAKAGSA